MANGAGQEGNEAGQPHLSVCGHGCARLDASAVAKNTRCDELHEKESKFTSQSEVWNQHTHLLARRFWVQSGSVQLEP